MERDDPVDLSEATDDREAPDLVGPAARRFRRRLLAAATVISVVSLLAGMLLANNAIDGRGGTHGMTLAVGDTVYVGLRGAVNRPVQLLWVSPATSDGLTARVEVCRSDQAGGIGLLSEAGAQEQCSALEPVTAGTKIDAEPPQGAGGDHLVVRLTATAPGLQTFCGMRIVYRAGASIGYVGHAGGTAELDITSPSVELLEGESTEAADRELC